MQDMPEAREVTAPTPDEFVRWLEDKIVSVLGSKLCTCEGARRCDACRLGWFARAAYARGREDERQVHAAAIHTGLPDDARPAKPGEGE